MSGIKIKGDDMKPATHVFALAAFLAASIASPAYAKTVVLNCMLKTVKNPTPLQYTFSIDTDANTLNVGELAMTGALQTSAGTYSTIIQDNDGDIFVKINRTTLYAEIGGVDGGSGSVERGSCKLAGEPRI
jgi:hypothetical protein